MMNRENMLSGYEVKRLSVHGAMPGSPEAMEGRANMR